MNVRVVVSSSTQEIESRLAEEYRQGIVEMRRASDDFAAIDKEAW